MSNISMKLARTFTFSMWSIASMALAGQGKTPSPACYEGGPQGKAVTTAKTQEECQKLGEKFSWVEATPAADHKAHKGKAKEKVKQQAKSETKPSHAAEQTTEAAAVAQPAATPGPAPTSEAAKK